MALANAFLKMNKCKLVQVHNKIVASINSRGPTLKIYFKRNILESRKFIIIFIDLVKNRQIGNKTINTQCSSVTFRTYEQTDQTSHELKTESLYKQE